MVKALVGFIKSGPQIDFEAASDARVGVQRQSFHHTVLRVTHACNDIIVFEDEQMQSAFEFFLDGFSLCFALARNFVIFGLIFGLQCFLLLTTWIRISKV